MNIESLYDSTIAKLTAAGRVVSLSQGLRATRKNDERVSQIYSVLEEFNMFPSILTQEKNEPVSTHYRNLGNKCFLKLNDYQAWQFYNLSLLYAPLNSESYTLALANRSAVLFSINKFRECIIDIDNIFFLTCPERIKDKLIKRKSLCKERRSVQDLGGNFPNYESNKHLELESSQGPRFSCASDKIEVVCNEEMGRQVIAKTDIKVGEVLVQEEPYFKLLLKSQYVFSCSYCLSRDANLSPCHECCFALYCSDTCREKARTEYHGIECSLMATLIEMKFTKLELLALRTVIKARNDHSDWNAFFQYIREVESNLDTEFRGHVKINDEWVYDSKHYASIHMLESNVDKRHVSDIFQKSISAAVFLWLLKKTEFLNSGNMEQDEEIAKQVGGLLLQHIMTSPTNMHGLSTSTDNGFGEFVEELSLASAPYAFLSLINHSCSPNVVRFSTLGTGRTTLFALRPIKKGMQLFDNYGAHHAIQDRKTRQQSLKYQYKFTCLCEACENDWPLYINFRPTPNLDMNLKIRKEQLLNVNAMLNLQIGNMAAALRLYKPLCELSEELEPFIPCQELADCQETLKQCLQIFQGTLPRGFSDFIEWNARPSI